MSGTRTLLSAEDTKTIRFTPEAEQSEFRNELGIKCLQILETFINNSPFSGPLIPLFNNSGLMTLVDFSYPLSSLLRRMEELQ